MPPGRKLAPLVLSDEQREQLLARTRSTSMSQGLVLRARIVLASAEGLTNAAVSKRIGISLPTVGKWRSRFLALGLQGPHDDEKVATVINRAQHVKPARSGTWSGRQMADAEGVSKSTVQRGFALFGVKPHLAETFKLSSDPFFIEKVRDITGLYLNPPDHAVVLCIDEKTQTQALDRTQPALPMGFGYAGGYTHDYVRHGSTPLFAALDVATGKGIVRCQQRHRHQVARLPAAARQGDPRGPRHSPFVRQLRHAPAREGVRLDRQAAALAPALHPDLRLVTEPSRVLVWAAQPTPHHARHVPQRHGTQTADHGLHQKITTSHRSRSYGWQRPTRSSRSSSVYENVLAGHYPSRGRI